MQDSIAKEKKWGKKMSENFAIKGGGGGRLMANAILNFHFDFLNPSLMNGHNHYLTSLNQLLLLMLKGDPKIIGNMELKAQSYYN